MQLPIDAAIPSLPRSSRPAFTRIYALTLVALGVALGAAALLGG